MYFPRKQKRLKDETVKITLLITCKEGIGVSFQYRIWVLD